MMMAVEFGGMAAVSGPSGFWPSRILLHSNDSDTAGAVFAGIDWGGSFHQLCLLDATGQVMSQQRVSHDVPGLARLGQVLTGYAGRVRVAIERSEGVLVEQLHT